LLLLIKYFLDTFYYSLALIAVRATSFKYRSPYNPFYHKLITIIFLYLKTKKIVLTSSKQQLPLHRIRKANSDTAEKLVLNNYYLNITRELDHVVPLPKPLLYLQFQSHSQ